MNKRQTRFATLAACLLAALTLNAAEEWKNFKVIVDANNPQHWKGTTLDTSITFKNEPTQRWEHGKNASVSLPLFPKDLTTHTHLLINLYSHKPVKRTFIIHLRADDPNSKGDDYYHHFFNINFSGWKQFLIPVKKLIAARNPLGLDKITSANLHAAGWHSTPHKEAIVNIASIQLVDYRSIFMTNAELFDAIDWTYPGLEEAAEAWKQKDEPKTAKLIADYFRNRTSITWPYNPQDNNRTFGYNKHAAETAARGEVSVVCVPYTFPDGNFDWFYNHTIADPKLPNNHEWQWQLNRMGFWPNMGAMYRMTKDETLAKAFVKQLRSWTEQCPPPRTSSGNHAGSSWRTIECGIRLLGSWPWAYAHFLKSPSFTDDDLLLFIRASVEQMRHLVKNPQTGNWLTMEMNGVYTCAAMFPELKEAKQARLFAIDKIYQDIKTQFLPDGAQFELTPGYHQVALGNVMALPTKAKSFNLTDELPKDFTQLLEKAYDFNLNLMTPNGSLPKYNDSWECNVPGSLDFALDFFPERQDFQYIATKGKQGKKPGYTSVFLPWAGYAALRSGWNSDDTYIGFDAGPLGNGHYHQDKLNLVIYKGKDELLFDDGGGCYESSPFRSYATTAFGHNVILVDGLPQVRNPRDKKNKVVDKPIHIPWFSTPECDFASANYTDGFGNDTNKIVTHTRQLLYLKPDVLVVCDILQPNDDKPHTYQQRWNINATQLNQFLPNHPAQVTERPEGAANLATIPLLISGWNPDDPQAGSFKTKCVSQQTEPEVLGWYVIKDAGPYRPATTFCLEQAGTGAKLFMTMFITLEPGEKVPVKNVTQLSPNQAEVTFTDNRKLVLTAPTTPSDKLMFQFVEAND